MIFYTENFQIYLGMNGKLKNLFYDTVVVHKPLENRNSTQKSAIKIVKHLKYDILAK